MKINIEYKVHLPSFFSLLDALKKQGYEWQEGTRYYKDGTRVIAGHDLIEIEFKQRQGSYRAMPEVTPDIMQQSERDTMRLILQYITPTKIRDEHQREVDITRFMN